MNAFVMPYDNTKIPQPPHLHTSDFTSSSVFIGLSHSDNQMNHFFTKKLMASTVMRFAAPLAQQQRRTFFTPIAQHQQQQVAHMMPHFQPQFHAPQPQQLFTPTPMTNFAFAQRCALNLQTNFNQKATLVEEAIEFMNRNKRKPKKANHGARPCSSVSRNKKKLRRHHYPK